MDATESAGQKAGVCTTGTWDVTLRTCYYTQTGTLRFGTKRRDTSCGVWALQLKVSDGPQRGGFG